MTKEIKFDNYIESNEITFFDKVPCDDNSVVYKSNYTIAGNSIPFIIVVDDSLFTMLQCRLIKLNNPAKRENLLYLLNQLNSNYKANKFVLTDDDDVDFSISFISTDEEFDPELIVGLTYNIMKGLEDDYSKIMRVIWS